MQQQVQDMQRQKDGATIMYINYNNGSIARVAGAIGQTSSNPYTEGFKIEIDFNTKQFYLKGNDYYWSQDGSSYTLHTVARDGYTQFDTIESIEIKGKYGNGNRGFTIAVYKEL